MSDLNTTDLIEVVGGSLRGLWLRLVDGKMLVVDIAENDELLDARTEVTRWEKQPTVFIGVDPEKKAVMPPLPVWVPLEVWLVRPCGLRPI